MLVTPYWFYVIGILVSSLVVFFFYKKELQIPFKKIVITVLVLGIMAVAGSLALIQEKNIFIAKFEEVLIKNGASNSDIKELKAQISYLCEMRNFVFSQKEQETILKGKNISNEKAILDFITNTKLTPYNIEKILKIQSILFKK